MTDLTRRAKMRAIIEDPDIDHDLEIGGDVPMASLAAAALPQRIVDRAQAFEANHPANLLAQTMQAAGRLELVLDEAAVIAKFSQGDV